MHHAVAIQEIHLAEPMAPKDLDKRRPTEPPPPSCQRFTVERKFLVRREKSARYVGPHLAVAIGPAFSGIDAVPLAHIGEISGEEMPRRKRIGDESNVPTHTHEASSQVMAAHLKRRMPII